MSQTARRGAATLTIRNVDPRLKERLRLRAARHGHSLEAELREILRRALTGDEPREPNLAEAIRKRMAPFGGVEVEPHPPVLDDEPTSLER
ncbi:plasmid stabilization protein [Craurococcus roseus]|uniref:Plasmid stabilization protein n=1 Tax=Craurococcus roseus TaxID=77585 RepID=A0ABP3R2R9_9PROT